MHNEFKNTIQTSLKELKKEIKKTKDEEIVELLLIKQENLTSLLA